MGSNVQYDVSVIMALIDYIPVFIMGISAVILIKYFYGKMSGAMFTCFASGEVNVFIAGFLKATWKILYGAGICNFEVLNKMMMPIQSFGFLLTAIGLIWYVISTGKKKKSVTLYSVPPIFTGTIIFIPMMILGLGTICTCMSILAARKKRYIAILFFVICFFCYLCMGYLSSQDSTSATINWIEQSVNIFGQCSFLAGVLISLKEKA